MFSVEWYVLQIVGAPGTGKHQIARALLATESTRQINMFVAKSFLLDTFCSYVDCAYWSMQCTAK